MDPSKASPSKFFNPNFCVLIPRYQRRYSWDVAKAHGLVRDVLDASTGPNLWAGVIIYRESDVSRPEIACEIAKTEMNHICREIIDGQQRLTTVQLWIRALLAHSLASGTSINYSEPHLWLQVPNDEQYKKILSGEDVFQRTEPMYEVYSYFRYLLWLGEDALLDAEPAQIPDRRLAGATHEERWTRHIENQGIERSASPNCEELLKSTLSRMTFLGLDVGGDDPERIFSALNGSRTELSQFDHLRNFVFGKLSGPIRDTLFDCSWQPAESMLDQLRQGRGRSTDINKSAFLYDYLISKGEGSQARFNASRAFQQFQAMERGGRLDVPISEWVGSQLENEVALWCFIREQRHMKQVPGGTALAITLQTRRSVARLRMLSDGPPNPFLLWLLRNAFLEANDEKAMTITEVEELVRLFESVVLKLLLSESGITNLRSQMISGLGSLKKSARTIGGVRAADVAAEFLKGIVKDVKTGTIRNRLENGSTRPYQILKSRGTIALLDIIEEQRSGGTSRGFLTDELDHGQDSFSVEHILPQKLDKWKRDLKVWGVKDGQTQNLQEHFGNLTVLPGKKNTRLSNSEFGKKCSVVSSDAEMSSPQIQDWFESERWTNDEVRGRAAGLVDDLMARWKMDSI